MQIWRIARFTLVAALALFVVACAEDVAEPEAPVVVNKSPNDEREYAAVTLDNGLQVLMVSDTTTEKSAAALSVGVGAFSDPMDFQGMAHYLEHMLFMGSESFPEPDGYMNFAAENGGSSNAYTSSEITNYMITIENAAFPEALHRLSEFFSAPILDPGYIQKEKNAVNAEWSMRRESEGRSITVCSVRCWASIQPTALRSVISILWRTKIPANYTPPRLSSLSSITRRI